MRFSRLAAMALLIVPLTDLAAADDFKIIKLEQDVRALERQVQVLSRQLDELRLAATRAGEQPSGPAQRSASIPATSSDAWLSVSNWDRLRNGMTELEVISVLGPPTSMRATGATRVLLYAMEIGASGFLSGSVSLEDRQVVEVQRPMLK